MISQLEDEGGKPLYDVIGIQSHMHGGYWGAARTWEVCERFARFGKPLHFTETTVVSGPKKDADVGDHARGRAAAGGARRGVLHRAVLPPGRRGHHLVGFHRPGCLAASPGGSCPERHDAETRLRAAARFDQGQVVDQGRSSGPGRERRSHSRDSSAATKSRPSRGIDGSPASSSLTRDRRRAIDVQLA